MTNVVTIREAVARARSEGLPVSEYTLRRWIKTGAIPIRNAGRKALLYYPALVRFLTCADGGDIPPQTASATGCRPLPVTRGDSV